MVGGQVEDIEGARGLTALREMQAKKTGALIHAALVGGGVLVYGNWTDVRSKVSTETARTVRAGEQAQFSWGGQLHDVQPDKPERHGSEQAKPICGSQKEYPRAFLFELHRAK